MPGLGFWILPLVEGAGSRRKQLVRQAKLPVCLSEVKEQPCIRVCRYLHFDLGLLATRDDGARATVLALPAGRAHADCALRCYPAPRQSGLIRRVVEPAARKGSGDW